MENTINNDLIINKTVEYVKKTLEGEGTGHDWWHVLRVWNTSKHICKEEKANLFIVELGALLHDIADWKFTDGDFEVGVKKAKDYLESLEIETEVVSEVCDIIRNISFKGAGERSKIKNKEGEIVQDADRLDALGAIGIARVFAYGGSMGREIYNPNIKPEKNQTFAEYKNNNNSSLNHFYEKLFLLKNLMNTKTGKKMAIKRDKFMKKYLEEFYKEWNGE